MTAPTFGTYADCTIKGCGWTHHWQTDNVRWAFAGAVTRAECELARHTAERHPPKPQVVQAQRRKGITWRGQTHTIQSWSRRLGIPENVLSQRLARKWDIERALSTPNAGRRRSA